ncbi:MAG: AAA family ATPase [Acidobacteriota bacterium]
MMAAPSLVVGLLGAESTGKTTLALQLAAQLQARGLRVAVVPEVLREFCDRHGRTPDAHEQADLAREQSRRIEQARAEYSLVIADTTALMIAIYSDYIFSDRSLYADALAAHQTIDLTLLTAVDLPWIADGVQRDGEHVRAPVDALIRHTLRHAGVSHSVVQGEGDARLQSALSVVDHALVVAQARAAGLARKPWRWMCEKCDDGDCEQHWLPRV